MVGWLVGVFVVVVWKRRGEGARVGGDGGSGVASCREEVGWGLEMVRPSFAWLWGLVEGLEEL